MKAAAPLSLGNDIVDLSVLEPELHPRYRERVFTEREREFIGDDSVRHAAAWAAKEACFKAVLRLNPSAVFSHKSFEFDPERKLVTWEGSEYPCQVTTGNSWVHALCSTKEEIFESPNLEVTIINCGEKEASSEVRSALVKAVFDKFGSKIAITPPSPNSENVIPKIIVGGAETSDPISISHHGNFGAGCVLFDGSFAN